MNLIWIKFIIQVIVLVIVCYVLFLVLVDYLSRQVWLLRLIGIDVLSLNISEIEQLKQDIEEAVTDYVEDYIEGEDNKFYLSLYALNKEFGFIVSDDVIMDFIDDCVGLDERIELFNVIEGVLIIEVNSKVLRDSYTKKVLKWKQEGQVDRIAYYEGEGRL